METSTGPEPVTCRRVVGLAIVTIDRPERRNALNLDVKRRLTTIEDVATFAGKPGSSTER
jgi:enoyl-CoA hydratase/carnithine racemase